jgi:hypothetical protein
MVFFLGVLGNGRVEMARFSQKSLLFFKCFLSVIKIPQNLVFLDFLIIFFSPGIEPKKV